MAVLGLYFGYFMISFIAVFLFIAAEAELNVVRQLETWRQPKT